MPEGGGGGRGWARGQKSSIIQKIGFLCENFLEVHTCNLTTTCQRVSILAPKIPFRVVYCNFYLS